MLKRIETLQSLRAVAIFMIFISHCEFISGSEGGALFNWAGAMGVSLFLCLSGFLAYVTDIGRQQPRSFGGVCTVVARKIGKFYPLHVATFVAAVPFAVFAAIKGENVFDKVSEGMLNLLLVQSWIPTGDVYFSYNAVSWFLSTYLLMVAATPFLLRMLAKLRSTASWKIVSCGLVAICFAAETALFMFFGESGASHWLLYICPPVRMIDFFAGMLVGMLYKDAQTFGGTLFGKLATGGGSSVSRSMDFSWQRLLHCQLCRISFSLRLGFYPRFWLSQCSLLQTMRRTLYSAPNPLSFLVM